MNDLLKLMQERRSIRNYKDEHIDDSKIDMILQAAMLSPSGKGAYPCEYIVVKDKEMLLKLAQCRIGSANMLKSADIAIVVLGNSNKSDTIIEDCSIALSNMHLMAHYLELGSCWIQIRNREANNHQSSEDYLRDLLHFPTHYKVEAILSIGIPLNKGKPHSLPELNNIHKEKY
jgi:nitroreductase